MLARCAAAFGLCCTFLVAQTSPSVEILSLPPYGAPSQILSGRVGTPVPSAFRVTVLIFVPGLGYFTKPVCAAPSAALDAQGRFNVSLNTGGSDSVATILTVLVVPAAASVPCVQGAPGIPADLASLAVARLTIPRPNPVQREIQFSGETWLVKSTPAPAGPGPNYFSDSTDNVFVDNIGRLHLKITKRGNTWYAAEVISKRPAGYGPYSVKVDSLPVFDPNIVFGAFTWADGDVQQREIDLLEIGKFGRPASDPSNAQNVVQPWNVAGNLNRFTLPPLAPQTHTMSYSAEQVSFRSADSGGATLSQWLYGRRPPVPGSEPVHFRLNFWLFGGAPPSDGAEAEIIVSEAAFPAAATPRLISLAPTSGAGTAQTFTGVFRHPGGTASHYLGYMLFLPTPNIVFYTAAGSCLVEYNRISNGIRLINDAGDNWLGPLEGVRIEPNAGSLTNSRCSVNVAGATANLSGEEMIVTAPVTFQAAAMTPVLGTFLQSLDVNGVWTDMRQFGNWVIPGAPARPGPSLFSFGMTNTTGGPVTFAITSAHTSGAAAIGQVHLLVSDAIVGRPTCQAVYLPGSNSLNLINAGGTALVSPNWVPLGTAQVLSNGLCSVDVGQAIRSVQGSNLTIVLPMSFDPASFSGPKNAYANVFDGFGSLSHWVQGGILTVQ